jgi:hypothetical protein
MTDRDGRYSDEGQKRRLVWVQIVLSMVGLLLVGRLAWYQLLGRVVPDPQDPEVIPAVRGSILDSNGHYRRPMHATCSFARTN